LAPHDGRRSPELLYLPCASGRGRQHLHGPPRTARRPSGAIRSGLFGSIPVGCGCAGVAQLFPSFSPLSSHEAWCCARYHAPVGKGLLDSEEINLASVSKGYPDGTRAKPQSSRLGISGCTGRLRTRRGRNAWGLAGQEFRAALGSAIHSPSRRARMCPREGPPWRRRFSCCALSAG
jgi:hypothetical protein